MAKSIPSSTKLHQIAKITSEKLINHSKQPKPKSINEVLNPETSKSILDFEKSKQSSNLNRATTPLSRVVSSCVKRWFRDTLKEARDGDSGKQVLVSQMYYNGYGIPKDARKGRAWITKASRSRSSMVWEVRNKQPGYNASDSDSDKLKDDNDVK
ncbi:uncharacterized protein LOC113278246 [Papaver somniferum]|uniref:uncharacterized protein LOC113278246 n=1 Tax=Papaver somniferum TaxID=3469 RepID=UPI000E70339B|nr:uncharacterized protein LOC113278246 [Papaver somniferum]XP_026382928.1 uncharacterized protein LOC113278246 [Papaver somniferum]